MDQHLFDGARGTVAAGLVGNVAAGVGKVKAHALEGITAIHEVLTESELGNPEPVQNLEGEFFYELKFTYGPLCGRVCVRRVDLVACQVDFGEQECHDSVACQVDFEVDGPYDHEPWENLYLVSGEHGPRFLAEDFKRFLRATLEKHVPAKCVTKQ